MSLYATNNFERTPVLEPGIYNAVCVRLIDLGTQYNERFDSSSHKIRIFWEILGETVEINGETINRQISKEYTVSLSDKSNLRAALRSWRGKDFTAEELQKFDLRNILGVGCQIQIIHNTTDKGTFANVETIIPLPKGQKLCSSEKPVCFDLDDVSTYAVFDSLPRFVQEQIALCEEFPATGLTLPKKEPRAAMDPKPSPTLPNPEEFDEEITLPEEDSFEPSF